MFGLHTSMVVYTICCIIHTVEWWYGPILCKAAPYLQGVAVGASVNTLVAVATERSVFGCV
jgi:hypothetical protein